MKPAENILDALCEAALEYEFFPADFTVVKRRFKGAHGPGATHDLLIRDTDGNTFRIAAELQPEPDNYGVSTRGRRAA